MAAACTLAAYVMSGTEVSQLRQAGFVNWPNSSVWDDVFSLVNGIGWPCESVWVDFEPNGKLAFAFTQLPNLWAGMSGAGVLLGGAGALFAAQLWPVLSSRPKQGLLAVSGFGFIIGVAALCQAASGETQHGFSVDLRRGIISNDAFGNGASIAMAGPIDLGIRDQQYSCSSFGRHHYHHRTCTAYTGYARNVNGQSLDLFTLDWPDKAYDLQNAIMAFVNSQGGQM